MPDSRKGKRGAPAAPAESVPLDAARLAPHLTAQELAALRRLRAAARAAGEAAGEDEDGPPPRP